MNNASTGGSQKRMSIRLTSDDCAIIEAAANAAGVPASSWVVQTVREEARWAVARQMAHELAAEAGVTEEDLASARSALRLDADEDDA